MGVLPDWMIKRDVKIEPAAEGIKRKGVVSSYGYSSYGYDARIGYKFRVFSPINATVIDPGNFDPNAYVEVDLTPEYGHLWQDMGESKKCYICGAWKDTVSETKYQCPTTKPDHILIPPHSFVLGETVETFTIPRDVLCIVVGKSTLARCGLVVNVTPLEPEWTGKVTVEVSNTTPLPAKVYCGQGIMQCIFLRTDGYREVMDLHFRISVANCGKTPDTAKLMLMDYERAKILGATCQVSYAGKKGKYQDQAGITLPKSEQGTSE